MRLKTIRTLYFFIILLIIIRLAYWQIVKADDLTAKGEGQRTLVNQVVAPRGSILFSDNSILASSQPAFLLFASPKDIDKHFEKEANPASASMQYKSDFAKKISPILWDVDQKISTISADLVPEEQKKTEIENIEKFVLNQLEKDVYWANLGRKVTLDVKNQLSKFNLVGLGFDDSTKRFYPEGSSSAHILGFIGSDIYGEDTGYFGLEGFYNGELRGKKGTLTQEKDALGVPILIGKFESRDPKPGKTLLLNIDRTIQHFVEEKLKAGFIKYGAKSASAIVMDPYTGNVLAMASFPNYDPSKPGQFPNENYKNPITADGYEPGSTFKVLVMASAINENLVTPKTVCDICAGPLSVGGFTIRTWNNEYQPNLTMTDTIIHSDNTGMVFVSRKLGIDKMFDYINRFGFGKITGIDVQDEYSPDIRDKKDWKEIDLATSSFGQGISATALQVVRAVGAIANGGKVMEPHLVSEIRDGDSVFKVKPRVIDTPISSESASQVKDMMVRAVEEGEAKFSRIKGFRVAGKTGTAQIPVAGHYDPTKTIASFVGFAPAENPKFIMLVRYDQPSSSIYGAETAAPTFFQIAQELFTYYGLSPDEPMDLQSNSKL